jgi:hypothetical protein
MKLLLLFLISIISCFAFAQEKEKFQLEARVIDTNGKPIEDAYIINFNDFNKYVSRPNGVFNIWVQASDSLIISHISYHRRVVTVYEILVNPYIELKLDSVNIQEVNISPNQKTESQIAKDNVADIKLQNFSTIPKIDDDPNPETAAVNQMVTEHNKVLRSEAQSLRIIQFSPGEIFGKIKKKRRARKKSKEYDSTRKKKQP